MIAPKLSITGVLSVCDSLVRLVDLNYVDEATAWSELAQSLSDHLPTLPMLPQRRFSRMGAKLVNLRWEDLSEQQCWEWTHFSKLNIEYLVLLLGIPDPFYTRKRNRIPANIALSIVLTRLAFPNRLLDLEHKFGIARQTLSMVINQLCDYLYKHWAKPLLTGFNQHLLSPSRLDVYASAIRARGCPMDCIWGFMDVTFSFICRPGNGQEATYNGYKKRHATKHNAIATPDGLIAHCSIPVEGRRADSAVLAVSNLEPLLERYAYGAGGRRMFVYADPAYGVTDTIISAAKEVRDLERTEQKFYSLMARGRMGVEWGFGKVFNYFQFLDFSRNNRLHLSPVGQYFMVAVLFTNVHTCLYGSITSRTFKLAPPALEDYLMGAVS